MSEPGIQGFAPPGLFAPAPPLPAGGLPPAPEGRFQPLRAGILNLWQYDEQELHFHQGRLLLRGENGAGKSKALELLLPFLLDADLSPQRLDPFGGTARTMEWNLLQDGRYESRVGYVWLEIGRRAPPSEIGGVGGEETFWTLGCGLRASQRARRVDSWYFLTRRRPGADLTLVSAGRAPLLKEQLRQQIGDEGWVFETGREYREKLDTQVFGLGPDRFAALRHLLLQLRRPHLSERLDPPTLSEFLKESLPPLDANLIGQLSEGFERLDNDHKELVRTEAAVREVAAFLDLYREYGRGIARSRAAEVRQADSRYHKTAGEVREAEEEEVRLGDRLGEIDAAAEELARRHAASRGVLRALEQSDAMRSAEVLRDKKERARERREQAAREREVAGREEQAADQRRQELDLAEGATRAAAVEREQSAGESATAARQAGLEAAEEAARAALAERPAAAEATLRAALRRREEQVGELRGLAAERHRARQHAERAADRLREADAQLRAAADRSLAARDEVDRAAAVLDQELAVWLGGLAELRLAPERSADLRARAAEIGAGSDADLAAVVEEAARPTREALVRERTLAEEEAARTARERREVDEERRRVEAARELGPQPPRTRQRDAYRPGAPLYLLCDFAPGVGPQARAGLEAALEAAGLLDAWVLPEGGWLRGGDLDTFLVPAPRDAAGRSLADVLVPSPGPPGHEVSRETVAAVLGSIALADVGLAEGPSWVDLEGGFGLGPLRGAWAKAEAEQIGAGAREAARARRLAELDARLAELGALLEDLAGRSGALGERLRRLDAELAALPSATALRRAAAQASGAAADERRRRDEQAAAASAEAAASAAAAAAEHRLAGRARELRLAAWLDDLVGYLLVLKSLEGRFGELVRTAAAETTAGQREAQARRLLGEAAARAAELRQQARESAAAAETARAEVEELEATVGADAREVVARHQAELRNLQELEARSESLTREAQEVREHRARVAERLALRRGDLGEREDERGRAAGRLRGVVEAGFLRLVLALEEEAPGAWSLTRALDLAREIERASSDVDLGAEAASRRVNRLHERYRQLAADLGADFQAGLGQDEDLVVIRVRHNGRDHDIPALLAALRESAEVRRSLLAEHERELLQRFLLGEVGDHLRDRLRRARLLVEDMNELLEGCRTASGMALKLSWDPLPEAAPEVREAVRLLLQDLALLAEGDRRRLEAFFQARISEARQHWESVPWRDHLLAALDYRAWHRFRILRREGDRGWVELTRRGHGASSGGEKAVALHLPLFAAAAAHYRSADPAAPRLIALDEAFAGIDQGMRGRCMGLLVAFDLDFLMTSHDEWGCYSELPGVATYQLYRDPALEGVAALRFVWNGQALEEVPE